MVNFTTAISTRKYRYKNRVYYEYYHLDGTRRSPGRLQGNLLCLPETGRYVWNCQAHSALPAGQCAKRLDGFEEFPFPPVATHLHKQPPLKRSCPKRCTGAVRTFRCQYHNECLRPLYKKGKAELRQTS